MEVVFFARANEVQTTVDVQTATVDGPTMDRRSTMDRRRTDERFKEVEVGDVGRPCEERDDSAW